MQKSNIRNSLATVLPSELVDCLLEAYINAIKQYRKKEWKYFGNDVGQFIEIVIRIVEYLIQGSYTSLKEKLPIFNDKLLISWENNSKNKEDSYRIIIPRVLYSMYCMRNKRGIIHKNHINPNFMDSSLLLNNMKWVLSELFRTTSQLSFDETNRIIEMINIKEYSLTWFIGNNVRILDTKMPCTMKILYLLLIESPKAEDDLMNNIEYSNSSRFKNILKKLHQERMIEYNNGMCTLSPKGELKIEEYIERRVA